jgi:chromate transporter
VGFTLPSAVLMYGFAVVAPKADSPLMAPVLHGLMLTALAVVAQAVWSMQWRRFPPLAIVGLCVGFSLIRQVQSL